MRYEPQQARGGGFGVSLGFLCQPNLRATGWLPLARALSMAQNGEIGETKTIAGIFRAMVRLAG